MINLKKKDIFIQDDISSCGARCIQSIVSYYGGYVPLEKALEDTNTDLSGTTALDLVKTLKTYGFDAYGIRVTLDAIDKNKLPIIGHTIKSGYEHFLVIYEITDYYCLTMDPEFGKKKYTREEFQNIFTKNAIIITPNGKIPKFEKSKSLIKTFSPIIKKQKFSIVKIVILSVCSLVLSIVPSFHLKLLNEVEINPYYLTVLLIILKMISFVINYCKENILEHIVKNIDEETLETFTEHIFKLPIRYLHNKRVGEIVKKIEDMTFIKDLLIRVYIVNSLDLLTILVLLPILLIMSQKLSIIYSIILLLYTIITVFTQKIIYKNETENLNTYNEYSGTLVEYLDGLESIKNLNTSKVFLYDIDVSLKNHTKVRYKCHITNTLIKMLKNIVFEIGALFIGLFGFLSISDTFSFLDLMTFESVFSLFFLSYESIITTLELFFKGKAVFRNICEFNDVREERCEPSFEEPFKSLSIKNLSYSYDRLHYTFNNFNLTLNKGDKILINGPSGIGKSTLVKCISGLETGYEGNILLNNTDTLQMSIESLRKYCLYIGQEEKIFRKSILENVTLNNEDRELFDRLTHLTLLDDVINKRSDKEYTTILEGASNLSGGERARLILTRALYRNPSVLIIDETLSSVSEEMEDIIIKNLLSIEDMSLIYITHRNKEKFFKKIIKFRKDGQYEINTK